MSEGACGLSTGVDPPESPSAVGPTAASSPGDLGTGFDLPGPQVEDMVLVEVDEDVEVVAPK